MNETRKKITLQFLLNALKQSKGVYGYDFWLSDAIHENTFLWHCAIQLLQSEPPPPYISPTMGMVRGMTLGEDTREIKTAKEIFPLAFDILWLLCIRGILRPGIREAGGQSVKQGEGYSLTLKGREWMKTFTEVDIQDLLANI